MRRIVLVIAALLFALPLSAQDGSYIRYYPAGTAGLSSSGTAITSTVPLLLPDGSAGAPSLAFASDTDTGFYRDSDPYLTYGGTPIMGWKAGNASIVISSAYSLSFGSGANARTASPDTILARDAANTLALRNSTNAQAFNIYNTYTDASNYERTTFAWSGNQFYVQVQAAGTGTLRTMNLGGGGKNWKIDSSGSFYPGNNDEGSIGTTSLQVQNLYVSRSIQGSKSKALTDGAAAASVVRIAVATNSYIGGKIIWTATSTDGTDQLATSGEQFFSGVDKAGTVTCGTGSAIGTATAYTTAATLVCTVSVATSTTNCDIQATCTNDTAGTQAIAFNYRLDMPLTATVTPQ
jgi:hypothetical protein